MIDSCNFILYETVVQSAHKLNRTENLAVTSHEQGYGIAPQEIATIWQTQYQPKNQ